MCTATNMQVTRFSNAKEGFSVPEDSNFDTIAEMRTWKSITGEGGPHNEHNSL